MTTAMVEAQANTRLRCAMDRLLHSLRPFMRAYGRTPEVEMPEHDLVWVDAMGRDGPGTVILEAIKANLALWIGALPKECCIVQRKMLSDYVGADAADVLAHYGANFVENQAARLLYEAEQRYLQKRSEE